MHISKPFRNSTQPIISSKEVGGHPFYVTFQYSLFWHQFLISMLLLESLNLCPPTFEEGYFHGIISNQREGKEKLLSISSESLTLPTNNRSGEDECCLIVVISPEMHMRKHILKQCILLLCPPQLNIDFMKNKGHE